MSNPESICKNEPLALGVDGTSEVTGVGRSKIYSEIAAGRLRALKVGRRTIIPMASITAWLEALPAKAA